MASATQETAERQSELWRRLEGVDDPELDEPITSMGFVERAEINADGSVEVDFRLPTYWCSPNFAFLMLDGIREAMEALSWRPSFRILLHDHLLADEVNEGIASGKPFNEIVGDLAADCNLTEVRATFAAKAYKRRQEAVLLGLRKHGLSDAQILTVGLSDFDALQWGGEEEAVQKRRYRQALVNRWPELGAQDPVFVRWNDGSRIEPEALKDYLRELRSIRINMEFSGALCRGLKDVRYKEAAFIDGEPTLVDFMLDRVPPRCGSPA